MTKATKHKLLEALERLLEGKPENRELRKKAREGKLKINNSTVEKEAGLSVGSLRRHEDVRVMIKTKLLEARGAQDGSSQTPIDLLQADIKQLKQDKTQANKKKKEYYDEAQSHKEALAVQAATHIKIVQDLMEMLPASEREKAIDKVVNARPDNIVEGNFRK
ncbi:bacterioferritin comigratory protein [Vibrio alginolyticus]|uniref:bacterioferritin comigratory protein n=1 Tax=Vibrio diabolicus TaxID=50719 RepID=UPI001EC58E2F|nr:bacterioferritin comigratory protein [Vibrio diabolicus]EGQ9573738.1 bacterioferritin comigratory protein [Vibrio alginolyticus]EGR2250317.1 bacterioferritin comigratory protein [Vibrio parahaemolyticus]EHR6433264.1 bacterioferritin comigratory protein [Vibrio parahaemolyticus]EHR6581305.1 bacterioferritin comigratory protein [Vibrio parahaemolyticus]EID0729492.1 bacterioferritin comigratory protein [Vibrio parahaemolyticus]